jgi:hypothetical protein
MDAKQAIDIAINYVKAVYPNSSDFLVEEIEISDDDTKWKVTVSFPEISLKGELTRSLMGHPRSYKIVTIDAKTGSVRSMKMRLDPS